jgi:hypothetical protein
MRKSVVWTLRIAAFLLAAVPLVVLVVGSCRKSWFPLPVYFYSWPRWGLYMIGGSLIVSPLIYMSVLYKVVLPFFSDAYDHRSWFFAPDDWTNDWRFVAALLLFFNLVCVFLLWPRLPLRLLLVGNRLVTIEGVASGQFHITYKIDSARESSAKSFKSWYRNVACPRGQTVQVQSIPRGMETYAETSARCCIYVDGQVAADSEWQRYTPARCSILVQ